MNRDGTDRPREEGDEERRERERERAKLVAIGQLERRSIHVQDDADPEAVVELLEARGPSSLAVTLTGGKARDAIDSAFRAALLPE